MHSVWLASMTNPVGQEQLERVGLAAVSKHMEVQFLASQGLVTALSTLVFNFAGPATIHTGICITPHEYNHCMQMGAYL